ncbi:MAG TPA: dephospho-CoA kinase [Microlunatus sp.]|nr:dephospho-CoA kinase [Microlunatus sp.]
MLRVGLTGGIATGKTAVSDLLREHGAVVIDADLLAREAVEPGTPGLAAVVDRFGQQVLIDGRLNREALGQIVFADPLARQDLERIIHPEVRRLAATMEAEADADAVVVHVIPLLVETGQQNDFDVLVVVDVAPELQLERLQERTGLDSASARSRIAAQASRQARLAAADVVVDNGATRDDLRRQIDGLWADLRLRATAG